MEKPESIYPAGETNFCGYGAITYLVLQDDPLGYAGHSFGYIPMARPIMVLSGSGLPKK